MYIYNSVLSLCHSNQHNGNCFGTTEAPFILNIAFYQIKKKKKEKKDAILHQAS